MISSLEALMEVAGLYRRHRRTASDPAELAAQLAGIRRSELRQFH
jgi:hypothetical protein